jgi:cytoskeletal protein RodZ
VQPSSLIFLVIVAIWVAYLIQHWVRRREHLATARSVDKFSEAMRVLERRTPLPTTLLAEATSPSASGAEAAKDSRPEVVVKHASISSPLRARRGETPLPPAHPVPLIELVPHKTAAQVALRRARGILFLAALVAVPVTLVLSVVNILKWLSVGIALVVLVGSVVWLRVSAIQEQQARKAQRLQKRRLEEARHRVSATARPTRDVVAPAAAADREDPHTSSAAEETPGGWKPVPVPPPTYTLKEPAYRPEPAPESDRPVPIEVEDDDIDVVSAGLRRRVGS